MPGNFGDCFNLAIWRFGNLEVNHQIKMSPIIRYQSRPDTHGLPDEALTEDEEKVVAAFQDYHTAKEARRAHVKRSMPTITTTFVGKLQKHGK